MLSVHCTPQEGGRKGNPLPFATPPHALIADPRLTPTDKVIAAALLFWARASEACWPSDATIGRRVGRSPGTVQRCLRRLEAAGWIAREKTAANRTGRLIRLAWRGKGEVAPQAGARPPQPSAREAPAAPARDEGDVIVREKQGRESGLDRRSRPEEAPRAKAIPPAPAAPTRSLSVPAPMPPKPEPQAPPLTPGVLGPAEVARLAELSPATRERVLILVATGDPVLVAEARKRLRPPPESRPAPTSTIEMLSRIRECPSHVAQAAELLARDLDDRKSWRGFHARCRDVWEGRIEPAALVSAYREATGPKARVPGAIFMVACRRWTG